MNLEILKAESDQLLKAFSQISATSFSQILDKNLINDILLDWGEAVESLESMALSIEANPDDNKAQITIKRRLHTLKGDCGVFGLHKVSDIFHQVESLLERYFEAGDCPSEMLLGVVDWLRKILHGLAAGDVQAEALSSPVETMEKLTMRTLVVDDDFTNRLLLQELLTKYGPVHIAVNGKEAVSSVFSAMEKKEPYDLICLDIMMPEMNGQEALKLIREKENKTGVMPGRGAKILMITGLKDSKNVMASFKEQSDGYLVKPVSKAVLLEELTKLCLINKKEPG